jgi:hypothetical protein
VTDLDWIARATRLFAWMIPGEARVYEVAELDPAKEVGGRLAVFSRS